MSLKILQCGHDPLLLMTREMILSRDGFRVLTSTDPLEASYLLAAESIDLLVLCHTLSEQEFQCILADARALKRPPNVLTLGPNALSPLARPKDSVFDTFNGPGQFLAAVHGLVDNNRGATPRH